MVGRAVPNSQGHPGTQHAAAAAADRRPGQDLLSSCPGIPHLPGDRRWQVLAAIWGSPGVGFGERGGPALLCLSVSVLERSRCSCMSVAVPSSRRGVQEITLSPPFHPLHPLVSAGPAAALCSALSSCPKPQHTPGISALASRLSQPCSAHECPFPPAGSGCVFTRSH